MLSTIVSGLHVPLQIFLKLYLIELIWLLIGLSTLDIFKGFDRNWQTCVQMNNWMKLLRSMINLIVLQDFNLIWYFANKETAVHKLTEEKRKLKITESNGSGPMASSPLNNKGKGI